MNAPYPNDYLTVLRAIPGWIGVAVNLIAFTLDVNVTPELTGTLDMFVADGLVTRDPTRNPPTYQLTRFGKLVATAARNGTTIEAAVKVQGQTCAICIYAPSDAIRPPFLCWELHTSGVVEQGGALNERHAWMQVKQVLDAMVSNEEVRA